MPTQALDPLTRRNLHAIVGDGAAAAMMIGVGETYLAAFALDLGSGEVAAGIIASGPLLAGAVLQLSAPAVVRRLRSNRRWVLACAATQMLSFVPLIGFAVTGWSSFAALFVVATFYWAGGLGAGAAWNTWVGHLVPSHLRATFFAHRTRIAQAAIFLGVLAGGLILQWGKSIGWPDWHAYWVIFLIALVSRCISLAYLWRQSEPPLADHDVRTVPPGEMLARLGASPDGRLLGYMLTVQFGVQIAAPYFTPYMRAEIHLSYSAFMTLLAAGFLGKVVTLPLCGRLAQRWGAHRLLWIGGVGLVPLSLFWFVSDRLIVLVPLQLAAGAAWAAYELATLLLFFEHLRAEERTSMLSMYNVANSAALLLGAGAGGLVLHHLGLGRLAYVTIFVLSVAARALSLLWLPRLAARPVPLVPLATGSVAVRPSAGTIERPILPTDD